MKLKISAMVNIAELPKKGAVVPANSKSKPPIKGPGTVAMLRTELAIPRIPPCSSAGDNRDRKLGTMVRMIPLPDAIMVKPARNKVML